MSDERIFRRPDTFSADLKRRYTELLTDAEFTRSVLANSTEAIQVLDLDARIEFMSAGAAQVAEEDDSDALIGISWLAFWPGDTQAQAVAAVTAAKAGKTSVFEGTRLTEAGEPSWWEVTVSPILGANGRPARLLAISRDVSERKLAQQTQQMLMQELHHRVRNMLAMVMAITSQSLARAASIDEGRLTVEQRLMALAEAHNLLREGDAGGDASLQQIVRGAIKPYDSGPSRFTVTGADVRLSSRGALAAAMTLHELCTNAVKYGALSADSGMVEIAWSIDEAIRRLRLTWRERGGPTVQAPTRRGFGTRVIEASFRDQLGGTVRMSFEPDGVVCAVDAPLAALQEASPDGAQD